VGKGYNYSSNIKYIMVLLGLSILLSIYLFIPYNLITNKFFNWIIYFLEPTITLPYNLIDYNILISSPKHTWLIEDIGNYLYTDIGGIIKLLLVTVILLLAIIGLFFML